MEKKHTHVGNHSFWHTDIRLPLLALSFRASLSFLTCVDSFCKPALGNSRSKKLLSHQCNTRCLVATNWHAVRHLRAPNAPPNCSLMIPFALHALSSHTLHRVSYRLGATLRRPSFRHVSDAHNSLTNATAPSHPQDNTFPASAIDTLHSCTIHSMPMSILCIATAPARPSSREHPGSVSPTFFFAFLPTSSAAESTPATQQKRHQRTSGNTHTAHQHHLKSSHVQRFHPNPATTSPLHSPRLHFTSKFRNLSLQKKQQLWNGTF